MGEGRGGIPAVLVAVDLIRGSLPEPGVIEGIVEAGAEGLLLVVAGLTVADAERAVAEVRAPSGVGTALLVEGDLALAAAVGLGVVLSEGGLATAEARRRLGGGRLLGRVVGSAGAAAAAAGADFLVVDLPSAEAGGEARERPSVDLRRIVERVWEPVIAAVGADERAALAAIRAGVSGVLIDAPVPEDRDFRSRVASVRAALVAAGALSGRETTSGRAAAPADPAGERMLVTLNGERLVLDGGTTVGDLIDDHGWRSPDVVTLVNGERVARRRLDELEVRDGDKIETHVGGPARR